MENLDRPDIIELLGRLGAENDATVLEAARELHRKVTASGASWDELLRQQGDAASDGGAGEAQEQQPPEAAASDAKPVAKEGPVSSPDKAEAARIIDRLLARKNLSSNLREDLAEFKRTLSDGSFDEVDSRYVRALAKRLGV
jgi:hypothetical protein